LVGSLSSGESSLRGLADSPNQESSCTARVPRIRYGPMTDSNISLGERELFVLVSKSHSLSKSFKVGMQAYGWCPESFNFVKPRESIAKQACSLSDESTEGSKSVCGHSF
jgi:hypothetical protein